MSKVCKKCGALYDEKAGGCPECSKKDLLLDRAEHRENDFIRSGTGIKRDIYEPAYKKPWYKRILPLLLALLLLLGLIAGIFFGFKSCSDKEKGYIYTPRKEFVRVDEETGIAYMNNIIIVFFEKGTSKKEVQRITDSLNGKIVGELPFISQYQIEIPEKTLDELDDICENLKKEDVVANATYDTVLNLSHASVVPNDPWPSGFGFSSEDWNESDPNGNNWWLEAIHAPSAWEYNNQLSTAKVGVVDSGFDLNHEDLKNVIKSADPHNDAEEHGSHVAGIIGAEANNQKGISGIVWDCEIYTSDWLLNDEQLEELFESGGGWSTTNQILGGSAMLIEGGAKTINLSAGNVVAGTSLPMDMINAEGYQTSTYLAQLLEHGYDYVIVQSAGNGNEYGESIDALYNGLFCAVTEENCFTTENVSAEDIIDRIIVVGAAKNDGDNNYSQFYWSNAGDRVDICAPGSVYSTVPGNISGSYAELQGTSMAAPVVTAVAALAWSANENLTGAQIKEIVCDEANTRFEVEDNQDLNHPFTNTYRMVDAELSVKAALGASAATPKPITPPDDKVCDYSKIIKQYKLAIQNDFYENGGNGAKDYLSLALLDNAIYDMHNNEDVHVYYALYDINKDGMSECLIASEGEDFIEYDLFTYDGSNPVRLFSIDDFGGEASFEVYDNGVVHVTDRTARSLHSYYNLKNGATRLSALEMNSDEEIESYESNEISFDWEEISSKPSRVTSSERDVVLVLDFSGSMEGKPLEETKKSAIEFVDTVFDDELHASIGIVTYDDDAYMSADFSDDRYYLEETIESLESSGGGTNIEEALELAKDMLDGSEAKKQTIVLMSDGVPNYGKTGDDLVEIADEIKEEDIYIYTLGFFSNLKNEKVKAQELMERLASLGCHYEVENSDNLIFFFGDIADMLNGEKYIYIRIACPVDVAVTHNGEMLSSAEDNKNIRTSFGSLTFEENPNSSSSEDKIKILRLKETGEEYNVSIVGTDDGMMNYTIAFMNDEGKYDDDIREFKDIEINDATRIDTVAVRANKTTLKVDNDGDGKYDLTYEAEVNGIGKLVNDSIIIYIVIGAVAFILLAGIITLVIILIVKKNKKRPGGGSYSGGVSFGDELTSRRSSPYSGGEMSGRAPSGGDKGSFL